MSPEEQTVVLGHMKENSGDTIICLRLRSR